MYLLKIIADIVRTTGTRFTDALVIQICSLKIRLFKIFNEIDQPNVLKFSERRNNPRTSC